MQTPCGRQLNFRVPVNDDLSCLLCLTRDTRLKDDDLASRMGLQSKELNKLMAVLGTDRLVST